MGVVCLPRADAQLFRPGSTRSERACGCSQSLLPPGTARDAVSAPGTRDDGGGDRFAGADLGCVLDHPAMCAARVLAAPHHQDLLRDGTPTYLDPRSKLGTHGRVSDELIHAPMVDGT